MDWLIYRMSRWFHCLNVKKQFDETLPWQQIQPEVEIKYHAEDRDFHKYEDAVSKRLTDEVRILCMILTGPNNHQTRARHVKATWGKRCNVLLFLSTVEDASLPTVALNVTEGWEYLWGKTKNGFKYAYENYKDEVDWFLKADDDTWVQKNKFLVQWKEPLFHKLHFLNEPAFSCDAGSTFVNFDSTSFRHLL